MPTLRLAVFDLDYTIWKPEMYQLYGKPRFVDAPSNLSPKEQAATRTIKTGKVLTDGGGSRMFVFPGASYALSDIHRLREEGQDIRAAVASKTDEPDWAQICMDNLVVVDKQSRASMTLSSCFGNLVEISFQNKTHHFRRLHNKTGIPYEEMVFFDNEYGNIRSVSTLGVHCVYTPDGMERKHWDETKKKYGLS